MERFPPPDFVESDHEVPSGDYVRQAEPRNQGFEYLDIAVLAGALGLGAWFVLKLRSRRAIFWLMIFSLLYFGFWRLGCVCAIGSVQNVSLGLFGGDYAVPWVVLAFFALPLVFTLFFGRIFCAGVCPLGALQDFVLLKPVKVPAWLAAGLGLFPFFYLASAILFAVTGSAFLICRYDPFITFFRMSGKAAIVVFSVCLLLICVFVGRAYCRFICPYAVLLRWFSRLSWRRVTITPDDCIQCRLCEDACPFGAIEKPTTEWPKKSFRNDKRLLIGLVVLLPVLVVVGGLVGSLFADSWSRAHADVRLAERIYLEDSGQAQDVTDESSAFRATGEPTEDLYARAENIRGQFATGSWWVGGFVGLCVGASLINGSIRKKRTDYEAKRSECVACGRCFSYCPREHARRSRENE